MYGFFHFTAKATYAAIAKTYAYLTPDLWKETVFTKSPYQEFTPRFMERNSLHKVATPGIHSLFGQKPSICGFSMPISETIPRTLCNMT